MLAALLWLLSLYPYCMVYRSIAHNKKEAHK